MLKTLIRRSALILLAAVAINAAAPAANAQTGEKTLGVAGGFATRNNGGFANVFFQYTLAPHVRIAPEIGYMFRNEGKSGFEISGDVHLPFRVARALNVYPLAGLTFNSWTHNSHTQSRVGLDFGGGFDLYLTSNLKLMLQGKYSLMNDVGGGFFQMGFGYVF